MSQIRFFIVCAPIGVTGNGGRRALEPGSGVLPTATRGTDRAPAKFSRRGAAGPEGPRSLGIVSRHRRFASWGCCEIHFLSLGPRRERPYDRRARQRHSDPVNWERSLNVTMSDTEPLVESDPDILGGTPVFFGTRVPVQTFIDMLEAGDGLDSF